ncbi:MAG: TVP38/TMEM64 family protein [Candidatus Woesearchaeota archaeon]
MISYKKFGGLLGFIVFVVIIFFLTQEYFSDIEALRSFINSFGLFAPLVFGILYIFSILFFIPASVFTLLAGILFGFVYGSVLVIFFSTLAATIAFFVSRKSSKRIRPLFEKNKVFTPVMIFLEKKSEKSTFVTFFILRSMFLHYATISYAAGLLKKTSFKGFILATFLTNLLYSTMLVFFGDNLFSNPVALLFPLIVIIFVITLSVVLKKKFGFD